MITVGLEGGSMRPLKAEDLPAVMAIENVVYSAPWTQKIFEDCMRSKYCLWVYVQGEIIQGYSVMSVAVGEAHILNISVRKTLQGQGLGRRIMGHMLALAAERGADTVLLEVRVSNAAAVHLYDDMGFNEVGRRKHYYPGEIDPQLREDALIFAKAVYRD